jgi:hypothetical protein
MVAWMQRTWWVVLSLAFLATSVCAQGWSQEYEKGLAEAKAGNWQAARAAFKQAAAYRTEDFSGPTNLPGPATERRQWRNGAPYSPNFLSAYSAYRIGTGMSGSARSEQYRTSAAELEALLAKGQFSPESFYYLNSIYLTLGETEKRVKLDESFTANRAKISFKVDTEPLAPEEIAAVQEMMNQAAPVVTQPPVTTPPGVTPPGVAPVTPPRPGVGVPAALGTRVQIIGNKYALVIGNSASKIPGLEVPFSSDDAQRVREALVTSAGYADENVDLVLNATAAQIMASAKALSERIPNDATVLIYFSGAGVNLDGKDYLAGVDTELATDSSTMASKGQIFKLFNDKGAKVFSFFQVNRPIVAGQYFGKEVPLYGRLSQMQATTQGEVVYGFARNGGSTGLFTDSFVASLNEFHTNQVPILEFGWQLFYRMRRGGTGSEGGGSRQTPTLPVVTNLASNAVF